MDFQPAITVISTALCLAVVLIGARWLNYRWWRRSLIAYRMRFPAGLTVDTVTDALAVIVPATRRWPLALEILATSRGIGHYVLVPAHLAPATFSRITTALPGTRLEEAPEYLTDRPRVRLARELRTRRRSQPLSADRGHQSISGVLAALYPLGPGERVRVQWVITATRPLGAVAEDAPASAVRADADKHAAPLADVSGRIAVSAAERPRAALLMSDVLGALAAVNGRHGGIRPRLLPTAMVARRVAARAVPLAPVWWPLLLNAAELAGLVALPVDGVSVPGLNVGTARQLPPPPGMRTRGVTVGFSNYPGMDSRPLALATDDRLRHAMIQGPTGSGKSELIKNMVLQDIGAGRGVIVIDPKADLVESIAARIPENRMDDVIVMDPASLTHPVGFNVLSVKGRDVHARELLVDQVVHVFADLWRTSWGPRTADVLRNCLLSLAHTRAPDGSDFTVIEIPELLTNERFRREVLRGPVPDAARPFWQAYEAMSEAEKAQVIGPAMNKLRAFSTRTALRLMLGQSQGIDLGSVYRDRRILLVPLSKGTIGPDAAHLLGSLLVTTLWQVTLGRSAVPSEQRHAVFAYLDEFQEFVRFGGSGELAEMLAQARGLRLGLNLAYQYLDQLSAEVASAVLGTVRTQIVFQLEYRDAETMARRFAPLLRQDLGALDAFEIAMRPCIDARTAAPVTGRTPAPDAPMRDSADVFRASLDRYGTPPADVEKAIQERIRPRISVVPPIGRQTGKEGNS